MSEKCSKHNIEYEKEMDDCHGCRGEGVIEDDDYGIIEMVPCWRCRGLGTMIYSICRQCDDEYEDELEQEIMDDQRRLTN